MGDSREPSVAKSTRTLTLNVESDIRKNTRSSTRPPNWANRLSTRISISPAFNAPPKQLINTLQPTYRLQPKTRPSIDILTKILKRVVEITCQNRPMERFLISRARRLCSSVAREIQMQVTGEEFDRYRVVVKVMIVERANQTGVSKMAFIWETDKDMWTNYVKETPLFMLNATVCVVYWE